MEEEQRNGVELAVDDGREGADLREVRGAELRQRPLAYLELARRDLLR